MFLVGAGVADGIQLKKKQQNITTKQKCHNSTQNFLPVPALGLSAAAKLCKGLSCGQQAGGQRAEPGGARCSQQH